MDVYILPWLGTSELIPQGSCTLDPRALLLLIATCGTRVTSKKERGKTWLPGSAGVSEEVEGSSANGRQRTRGQKPAE